jgi:hypothetical protein
VVDDTEFPLAVDDTELPLAIDDTEFPLAVDDTEFPLAVEDTEVDTAGRRAVVPVLLPTDESVEPAGTKWRSCGGPRSLFKDNDRRA